MREIVNTLLCYSIAIILLLFGMNFDEAETLFHTPNSGSESVEMVDCVTKATISEAKAFALQLTGIRTASPIQQLKNQSSFCKKETELCLGIVAGFFVTTQKLHSDRATDVTGSLDMRHRVAVLNYIHDLDGKKRVS